MPTRAAISPRSQPSDVADTGEQEISSCLEQIGGHKQPEEVAPRCRLPDSARDDPEQRSEDQIGECAARPHQPRFRAALEVYGRKRQGCAPVATHMPPRPRRT